MKKYIGFLSLIFCLNVSHNIVYSGSEVGITGSLWDDSPASAEDLSIELTSLVVTYLDGSFAYDPIEEDFFLIEGHFKFNGGFYLKVKAFDVSSDEKELQHTIELGKEALQSNCESFSTSESAQGFICSLELQGNNISTSSKIKLKFYKDEDKIFAESSIIELSKSIDAKKVMEGFFSTVINNIALSINEDAPLIDNPLEKEDTDSDGEVDIKDDFPTVPEPADGTSSVPVSVQTQNSESSASEIETSGGGDCSLDPNSTANGAGWLLDFIILGLPAALVGIRRRK